MRHKRQKKKTMYNYIMIMIVFTCLVTVGYALLSSLISVAGTATAPLQNKLDHQLNIYSSPYYSQIVTAHPYLARYSEVLTGGNTLTSTYSITSSKNNAVTWQTRLTYTNLNNYTLTSGAYTTATTCTSVTRTVTLSTATLARNATVTINVSLRHNTRNNRNCRTTITVTYAYSGITKYLYYYIDFL